MAGQDFGDEAGDMIWSWFKERARWLADRGSGLAAKGSASLAAFVLKKAWHGAGDVWDRIRADESADAAFSSLAGAVRGADADGIQAVEVAVDGKTPEIRAAAWDGLVSRMEDALHGQGVPDGAFGFDGSRVADDGIGVFTFDGGCKERVVAAMQASEAEREQADKAETLTVSLSMETPDRGPATGYADRLPATAEQVSAVERLAALGALSEGELAAAGDKAGWTAGTARGLMASAGTRVKVPMRGMNGVQIARAAARMRDEWEEKGLDGVEADFDFGANALLVKASDVSSFEAVVRQAVQDMAGEIVEDRARQERAASEAQTRVRGAEMAGTKGKASSGRRAGARGGLATQKQKSYLNGLVDAGKIPAGELAKLGDESTWTAHGVNALLNRYKDVAGELDLNASKRRGTPREGFEEKKARAMRASADVSSGKTPDPRRSGGAGAARGRARDDDGRSR